MTESSYRRATRYALLSVLQVVALAAATAGPGTTPGTIALILLSIALVWSWGFFFADVAMNEGLDEHERLWWRVAFCVVPGAIALYWLREIRPFRLTS